MALFTAIIFLIVNIIIIYYNVKQYCGALRAPAVICLISLFSIGPMMIQNLVMPIFDDSILPLFYFSISLCLIAFNFGFSKGCKRGDKLQMMKNLNTNKLKIVTIFFTCFGLLALIAYQGKIAAFDWVVAGFLQSFGIIAIFLSLTAIKDNGLKNSGIYKLTLIISSWCLIDYAFNIKGSRTRIFFIIVFYAIYLSRIYPEKAKGICKLFLWTFILGSIGSFSMGEYRNSIDKSFSERFSISQIIDNYKANLVGDIKISSNGQDLYNGAQYANYCWSNGEYNFGTFIWNGLVFNYIPQRFIGEEAKNSLMSPLENRAIVSKYTKGVTTVTGFGEAFAAFSILGFLIFYLIAYYIGRWWTCSFKSDFYLLLYCYSIMYVAPLTTHGIVYYISPLVFFFIAIYPFLKIGIIKKCQFLS